MFRRGYTNTVVCPNKKLPPGGGLWKQVPLHFWCVAATAKCWLHSFGKNQSAGLLLLVPVCCERSFCTPAGQCISQSLVCNGDQDCEDGLDERGCEPAGSQLSCDLEKMPPNSDLVGKG